MQPQISIYTSVYNSEQFIRECIESVLNQTIKDFEWYIYDDGSTDSSFSICREYAEIDKRIILAKGKNGTSIDKMNSFIRQARGEYIVFIDNDDYWDADYLEVMLAKIQESNCDCAISSYTLVDFAGKKLDWYTPTFRDYEVIERTELKKRFLTSLEIEGFRWNKIYKTKVYHNSKAIIENKFPADIGFEYELFGFVDKVVLVNNKGYYYRQSAGSEIAKVDINKTTGMLDTFIDIGAKAISEGLVKEGKFYMTWRYINSMFLRLKDKKLTKDEVKFLFYKYPLNNLMGLGLFGLLKIINSYENKREGRLIFSIKAIYVWLYAKQYERE